MKFVIGFLVFFNFLVFQVFAAVKEKKDENRDKSVVSLSRKCDSEAKELNSFEKNEKTCQETQTKESKKPNESKETEEPKEIDFQTSEVLLNGDVTRCSENEREEQKVGCFRFFLSKKKNSSRKIEAKPILVTKVPEATNPSKEVKYEDLSDPEPEYSQVDSGNQ